MTVLLLASAIGAAVVAGILFVFSNFVMRALARLEPREGMRAMQSINVEVLNPIFFVVFVGVGILSAIAAVQTFVSGTAATPIFVGATAYLVGCVGVTGLGNVPLNERLAREDPDHGHAEEVWQGYVARWSTWNHVRTVASLVAAVSFGFAVVGG